ncbi:MAG TPA: hypothetical protein VFF79_07520 [Conexibacter sp.]|jgi:RND superfamily putative drug exporter|nr:hypothetical protein [Conexibacter sp.]
MLGLGVGIDARCSSSRPTATQFGVALSVAVIIDATLVRCLPVPATIALMGRAAWWIPGWMDRHMPQVSVEGHGYFAARDGATDAAAAAAAQSGSPAK